MTHIVDFLSEDIIKLILTSLPIIDMAHMGTSNKLYQEEYVWCTVVERKYSEFTTLIDKKEAQTLYRHLSTRRIIPIYEDKIIRYLISSRYTVLFKMSIVPKISSIFP